MGSESGKSDKRHEQPPQHVRACSVTDHQCVLAADQGRNAHLTEARKADADDVGDPEDEAKVGPKAAPDLDQKGWNNKGNERPDGAQVRMVQPCNDALSEYAEQSKLTSRQHRTQTRRAGISRATSDLTVLRQGPRLAREPGTGGRPCRC